MYGSRSCASCFPTARGILPPAAFLLPCTARHYYIRVGRGIGTAMYGSRSCASCARGIGTSLYGILGNCSQRCSTSCIHAVVPSRGIRTSMCIRAVAGSAFGPWIFSHLTGAKYPS